MKSDPSSFREEAQVQVFRYDPSCDFQHRYDPFRAPLEKGMMILDILQFIYENLDGSLAFEHGCRYGRCGLCAVKMNGRPVLACQTPAEPAMTIEPLDNFPVVKDLVVERGEAEERIRQIHPYLERDPRHAAVPEILDPARFETFRSVSRCIGCLACYSSCPSFSLNRYGFSGPAALVDLARYAFDPRDVLDRAPLAYSAGLFNCFECGKCQEVCPQHIGIEESVLERLRSLAAAGRVVPPAVMEAATNLAARGTPFVIRGGGTTFLERMPPAAEEGAGEKIGLFIGCNINVDPRLQKIGSQFLEILGRLGKAAQTPAEQVCCGLPWMQMGEKEKAGSLVERNVDAFEGRSVRQVVTLCPGCAMVMKKEWPKILGNLRGRAPSFQVLDLSEYLLTLLPERGRMKEVSLRVTFHDPCHLGRGQGIYSAPREVLARVPGVKFREMPGADRCCGGGGMVRATNWKLAQAAAGQKIESARETGAEGVVTTCPTCLLQVGAARKASGSKELQVLHLLEVIHRALAG